MQPLSVLFALFGLALGSFGNVLLYRIRSGEAIFGRSHCPGCKRPLRAFELVPVLSYLCLGGKCKRCHAEISVQYPVVEAASCILFLLAITLLPLDPLGAFLLAMVLYFLLLACAYDYLYQHIPDAFTFLLALSAVMIVLRSGAYIDAAIGVSIALLWFGGQWLVTRKKAVGTGDIFLAAALGIFLGKGTVTMIILSYMVGAIILLILLASKSLPRTRTRIAFAPFLGIATLLTIAGVGQWYMSLFQ